MSAVRDISSSRNLKVVPINPCSKSSPANSLLFRHISFDVDMALQTRPILPGLFGCGWCGRYHSFPKVPFTLDASNIFTKYFSTSASIDGCYILFRFGTFWKQKLTHCWAVVVRQIRLGFTPPPTLFIPLACIFFVVLSFLPAGPSLTDWRR